MAGRDGAMDAGVEGVEDVEGDKGPRAGEEDGNVVLSGKTVLMRKQGGPMPGHQRGACTGISVSPPPFSSSVTELGYVA